jgi:hypothetical protein
MIVKLNGIASIYRFKCRHCYGVSASKHGFRVKPKIRLKKDLDLKESSSGRQICVWGGAGSVV